MDSAIQRLEDPQQLRLPVDSMKCLVAVGGRVDAGCLVAEGSSDEGWYRCAHAPLQSIVTAIDQEPKDMSKNHSRWLELLVQGHTVAHEPCGHEHPHELAPEEIADAARRAGLVGMGGGMFPTYVKLSPEKPIDWVIINGCEGEPYLTCDHRVLVEHREEVECGMRLAMRAVGAANGKIIDAEDDFLDGYEVRLIQNVLGRQVPKGGRPSDVGVVVLNVQSARALHHAVCARRPLLERVVTVDGNAMKRPGNYVIPLGTEIRHVLDACGIDWDQAPTLIAGGPIMGRAMQAEAIVNAGTSGVLALTRDEISKPSFDPCIRCGECQEVCPIALPSRQLIRQPNDMLLECIECGMCQFTCPAQRPILQEIRKAKSQLRDTTK